MKGDRRSPNRRRVRLVDVASRAGVSTALVSSVLRDVGRNTTTIRVAPRTAQRIRRIASEMDYRPDQVAQQMRGAASSMIGVLIGADSPQANFRRLATVEQLAYSRGRRLMIGHFHRDDDHTAADYLHDFLDRRIDRLLCFGNPSPKPDRTSMMLLRQFRSCVFQANEPDLPNAWSVDIDRHAGVVQAYRHLAERGRRRIALLLNDAPVNDPLMKERYLGYRAALDEARRPTERELMWFGTGEYPPPRELVDQAIRRLLAHRADAVIASNDVWAIEMVKGLRRAGRVVPRDVAVIGSDNLDAARLFDPGITSVDPDYDEFARVAIELLFNEFAGDRSRERRRRIMPHLVVREST